MVLIGSSMGGYIAARYAELHPEQVAKLVLLCPGEQDGGPLHPQDHGC
jgi:pimeloyl-ACP methyl ester carboxylesterase